MRRRDETRVAVRTPRTPRLGSLHAAGSAEPALYKLTLFPVIAFFNIRFRFKNTKLPSPPSHGFCSPPPPPARPSQILRSHMLPPLSSSHWERDPPPSASSADSSRCGSAWSFQQGMSMNLEKGTLRRHRTHITTRMRGQHEVDVCVDVVQRARACVYHMVHHMDVSREFGLTCGM